MLIGDLNSMKEVCCDTGIVMLLCKEMCVRLKGFGWWIEFNLRMLNGWLKLIEVNIISLYGWRRFVFIPNFP
jgi:hypothetical protein